MALLVRLFLLLFVIVNNTSRISPDQTDLVARHVEDVVGRNESGTMYEKSEVYNCSCIRSNMYTLCTGALLKRRLLCGLSFPKFVLPFFGRRLPFFERSMLLSDNTSPSSDQRHIIVNVS